MAKKTKVKVEKDTSERWLLTYSDLMNLLLILFIILFASSRTDAAQFQQVAESLRIGFSAFSMGSAVVDSGSGSGNGESGEGSDSFWSAAIIQNTEDVGMGTGAAGLDGTGSVDTQYEDFYNALMLLLEQNDLTESVTVTSESRGVAISFADNVLFAKSSAVINESAYQLIDKIGVLLLELPFSYILVEGHADSDQFHNWYYEDNMDLSAKRAANVWRRLVACGLAPEKMASVGYGEYRPIAPNDTVENKAKNRRVVITILREDISTSDNSLLSIIEGGSADDSETTASP